MSNGPSKEAEEDFIAFFRKLAPNERQAIQALADLDRRFGEDIEAEQRALQTSSEKPS